MTMPWWCLFWTLVLAAPHWSKGNAVSASEKYVAALNNKAANASQTSGVSQIIIDNSRNNTVNTERENNTHYTVILDGKSNYTRVSTKTSGSNESIAIFTNLLANTRNNTVTLTEGSSGKTRESSADVNISNISSQSDASLSRTAKIEDERKTKILNDYDDDDMTGRLLVAVARTLVTTSLTTSTTTSYPTCAAAAVTTACKRKRKLHRIQKMNPGESEPFLDGSFEILSTHARDTVRSSRLILWQSSVTTVTVVTTTAGTVTITVAFQCSYSPGFPTVCG